MTDLRDTMNRCRHCRKLSKDADCEQDKVTGAFLCPNGCREAYAQPDYQSPLPSESDYEESHDS